MSDPNWSWNGESWIFGASEILNERVKEDIQKSTLANPISTSGHAVAYSYSYDSKCTAVAILDEQASVHQWYSFEWDYSASAILDEQALEEAGEYL